MQPRIHKVAVAGSVELSTANYKLPLTRSKCSRSWVWLSIIGILPLYSSITLALNYIVEEGSAVSVVARGRVYEQGAT